MVHDFAASFDAEKVFRLLGAREGRRVSASSRRRVHNLSQDMDALVDPRLSYRTLTLAGVNQGGIELEDGTCFKSPKLARAMASADRVCCFVATLGPELEMKVHRLMQLRRHADACVLDALGSMSAESIVEQFYQRMAQRLAKENRGVTLRFSPGYCDWPLAQQQPLFALFANQAPLRVELNQSCLMSPRKSVSGLFGIVPGGVACADPSYNPCTMCAKRDCIARRSR